MAKDWHQEHLQKLVRGRARWVQVESKLNRRDGRNRCVACQKNLQGILNKHHIKPVSKGGESWIENLVRLCPNCHAFVHWCQKQTLTIEDRIEYLTRFDFPRLQRFRIALLSTECVYVDHDGDIRPRQKILPNEPVVFVELFRLLCWWPKGWEDYSEESAA